jgi:hypothetical protein
MWHTLKLHMSLSQLVSAYKLICGKSHGYQDWFIKGRWHMLANEDVQTQ